jgi:glycosyltransferase involved in cell wall biosynthesis
MVEVSVIIPAYNAEKTVRESIQSVLEQTFKNLEVIVVNDGSTDRTLEIVSSLKDSRITIISSKNSGPSAARNLGIKYACGQYVSFLDSDDLWLPSKLEDQLNILKTSNEAKVVYSWVDNIDEGGFRLGVGSRSTISGDAYPYLLVSNFIRNGSNILTERSCLNETGFFNVNLRGPEDRDMWLRLASKYKFVVCPKVHILYRQSPNSLSSNVENQAENAYRMLELAYHRAPSQYHYLKPKSYFNVNIALCVKAFQSPCRRQFIFQGLNLYLKIAFQSPKILIKGISIKIIAKSLIALIVIPERLRSWLLNTLSDYIDTTTLLGYMDTSIS